MTLLTGALANVARIVEGASIVRSSLAAAAILAVSCSAVHAASCENLMFAKLPNTTINSAESISAGTYQPPGSATAFTDLPAFCRVTATVKPVPDSSIGIEVWLPTTAWNGRYQQVGNHGFAGTIWWSEMAPQLRRGFATGATDDGHPASSNPFNVSWAFGHPAKIDDLAWRAVHKLAESAKLLIVDYYGKHQSNAYFNGCSDGGREGLREAHDFPKDFNGILVGGVASYWTHAATEQLFMSTNLQNSGIQGTSGAALLTLIQNAATKACGEVLHGTADGLIPDPRSCHWDPHALTCKTGQNPATCLTPAQADAITANVDPVRDPVTGKWVFSGMSRGSEFDQIRFGYNEGLAPFGISNYQIALNDPNWDGSTFDLHADLPKVDRVLGVMNLTDTDLRPFEAAGGKLIQWHGWDDAAFTPGWTTKYYEEVVADIGRGNLKDVQHFYRLFMLPGVGHCGTGIGPDDIGAENQTAVSSDPEHDAVSALLDWVENNHAPDKFIATKFNVVDDLDSGIQMQRPICAYPEQAIYNGSGNIYDAMNFHCGKPRTEGDRPGRGND
jgi:feruloyl esterase